jgi:enamine deaminase RidA (YjgF/YER057c/UK114 family)
MKQFELFESRIGSGQFYITAAINEERLPASEVTENLYRELASILSSGNMQILYERVFGSLEYYEIFADIRRRYFDFAGGNFSYIQGESCSGKGLAGVQIHAVKPESQNDHWVIYHNNFPCGYSWKCGETTYIHLAGIDGLRNGACEREKQTSLMFDIINQVLVSQSSGFDNVARIWIYLEDILEWYDEFNSIRTENFKTFGLMPESITESEMDRIYLPASTGIGGRNPARASVFADVLAISGDVQVSVLPGVRQRSAYRYGSAFSRGVCIQERDYGQIFVSGTAAIDEQGNSLYPGNVEAQIIRTMETVESLIAEKGAKLENIKSATIYLKRSGDLSVYKKVAARFGLTHMPVICVVADICRDELLFEMEALAVISRQ